MNQILSVEMEKGKKPKKQRNSGETIEIKKVIRFFAISLIIFGICIIGGASYGMYKEAHKSTEVVLVSPILKIIDMSETEIKLEIEAGVNLATISYNWDNGETVPIDCIGKKKVEQIIAKPDGKTKLYVFAKDINGKSVEQTKRYNRGAGETDNIKLNIEREGNKIKITAQGKDELAYFTYRWDEEEETKVEINDTQIEHTIDVLLGEHTLTVIAVDINNYTKTEERPVKGITKPKIDVGLEDESFKIIVTAEDGISKIEYTLNDSENSTTDLSDRPLEERKEYEELYPIIEGENKLKIVVYSESGATEEKKVKITK